MHVGCIISNSKGHFNIPIKKFTDTIHKSQFKMHIHFQSFAISTNCRIVGMVSQYFKNSNSKSISVECRNFVVIT